MSAVAVTFKDEDCGDGRLPSPTPPRRQTLTAASAPSATRLWPTGVDALSRTAKSKPWRSLAKGL